MAKGKRKVVRQVRTKERECINRLADILKNFLPLTTHLKNAISFTSIFRQSGIDRYLKGPSNKKLALQQGWLRVYKYHSRVPYTLIRRIIPAAIDYRRHIRWPLTNEELKRLSACLCELGIDMRKEISSIELEESLPRIQVPSKVLIERLKDHPLVPDIASVPFDLFQNGHFNESVRKACELLESKVQELSSSSKSGRELMATFFSSPAHIDVTSIKLQNQSSFVEGYKFLPMGAMAAIRNIFSHGDEEARAPEECYEMLLFLNWLFRFIN